MAFPVSDAASSDLVALTQDTWGRLRRQLAAEQSTNRKLAHRVRQLERARHNLYQFVAVTLGDLLPATVTDGEITPGTGQVVPYVWNGARYVPDRKGDGTWDVWEVHNLMGAVIPKERVVWVQQEHRTNQLQVIQQLCDSQVVIPTGGE